MSTQDSQPPERPGSEAPTTPEGQHQRRLLREHLRRLLVIDERLAQRLDDVTLKLEREITAEQIGRIGAGLGLRGLPEGMADLAAAVGLADELTASLGRQEASLTVYRREVEIQAARASAEARVTLGLLRGEVEGRLAELARQQGKPPAPAQPQPPAPHATPRPQTPARPPALSADQHRRLRDLLARCDELDRNGDLQAVFADPRLAAWRAGLPEADTLKARVDRLIAYLQPRRNRDGQAALGLLLQALAERYDPEDALHGDLLGLAGEI